MFRSDVKRVSGGDEGYWPPAKRQAVETVSPSYTHNVYGSGGWV